MADGNTGDTTKHVVDQPATNANQAVDGHTAALLADSQQRTPADAPAKNASDVVKDASRVSDKVSEQLKETTTAPGAQVMTHLRNASAASAEIVNLVKAKTKDDDTVQWKDDKGVAHSGKASERVAELKKTIDAEANAAVASAEKIKPADAAKLSEAAINDRNNLAKALDLDPHMVNQKSIKAALDATSDPGRQAELVKLSELQKKVEDSKFFENAPAYSRMLYASYKASGMTDVSTGMQKDANGGLKTNQKDVLDAVQLLHEAGQNKDLRLSKYYVDAMKYVLPKLENSSEKVQTLTKDLQDATTAGAKGDKATQEKLLKDAVTQADQTNTAAICQMLRDPAFVASQRNKDVMQTLATSAVMASTARLQYAQFLAEEGKFSEAQGLALRVKTELPEVMYNRDPKDPNKVNYADSRFVNLAKLDQELAQSSTVEPNKVRNLLDDFNTAMANHVYVSKDGTRGAKDIITEANHAAAKRVTDIADGQKGLELARTQALQEKKDLDSKKSLSDGEKVLEQKQIDRELALIDLQSKTLQAQAEDAKRAVNAVKFYEAALDITTDDRNSARARLAEIKASDPKMAAAKTADGQDSDFAKMEKAAEEPTWWDRNWRKVATAGAVVAGVAVGALTFWSGPGAVVFGAGTTAALMGTVGASVVAGGVAGAGTFLGTHEGLYHSGVVSEKVDAWKDIRQGGSAGAMGALMFVGMPAMVGAASIGVAGAGTEGAVLATTATTATLGSTAALTGEGVALTTAATTTAATTTAAATGEGAVIATSTATATAGGGAAANTSLQAASWGVKALRVGAVSFSGAAPNAVFDYYGKDKEERSLSGEAKTVAGMTLVPMLLPVGGAGLKAIGLMKAAPAVEAVSSKVPSLLGRGNLISSTIGIGSMQAAETFKEYNIAAQLGPQYSFLPDGSVGPIKNSIAIFGPQDYTRGWDPTITREKRNMMDNWQNIDPGISYEDLATEKKIDPIKTTTSDFTDAKDLSPAPTTDTTPDPNKKP